jgi:hypothetical protein
VSQNERKPPPIGQDTPKTPAERVRMIQELQRAQEAAPLHEAHATPQATPAAPTTAAAPSHGVPDAFAVKTVNAVAQALAPKTSADEASAYGKLQRSAQALFGSSTELEVLGNPWKVIPFGDTLGALFDDVGEAKPHVPEKAVQTSEGALFELGLTPKGAAAPTQKRAVLVNAEGRLAGAECHTPQDVTRLLTGAKWLLPVPARAEGTKWAVSAGTDSAFTLRLEQAGKARPTELALDNFGRLTTTGRKSDLVVASYFLDRFDAAV